MLLGLFTTCLESSIRFSLGLCSRFEMAESHLQTTHEDISVHLRKPSLTLYRVGLFS